MLSEAEMRSKLIRMLPKRRFIHSLGVEKTAIKLARFYGADWKKAQIAGLIHDCARDLGSGELLKMVERFGIVVDEIELLEPKLLHAPVGAVLATQEFGIEDEEILNAIRLHTTGSQDMSLLDKILYVADYAEPGRSFAGAKVLRKVALEDIDEAVRLAMDQTLLYLVKRGSLIHPRTIEARNAILLKGGDLDSRHEALTGRLGFPCFPGGSDS